MDKDSTIKILAVVAARGGSKGVKNKNIRDLLGKPLIAYTIAQVIKWGKFDKFIVSTDSEEIAKVAKDYAAEVPFLRPPELATDTANKMDALRHAFIETQRHYNIKFDALLDLDVTAPARTIEDIENIVCLFKEKRPDCIFSVVKARRNPYFNMVEKQTDGIVRISKELPFKIIRRQDVPEVYEMNCSMYVYNKDFLLDAHNKIPYAKKSIVYEMPELSRIDIDTELDFKFVEFLIKEGLIKLQY